MTGLIADPFCKQHDPGPNHPESPERFDAVMEGLKRGGLIERLVPIDSRDATYDELRLCHAADYLSMAEYQIREGHDELRTGDTHVCEQSWDVAVRSVGGVLNAVDAVMAGRVQNAFCAVRPPGHHATADRAMGFCILNNVAIAARYAQRQHGVGKVLIVDWDAHHGNGTQDIFYEDGSIFFFSTHQITEYPRTGSHTETGAGAGIGTTLNCPMPAGAGRADIFEAFEKQLRPAAGAFRPDLVLISAGFDSRIDDPLGDFKLTDDDFADLTRLVADIAGPTGGRIVSVMEGGYNLAGLAAAVSAHVGALMTG